MLGRLVQVSVNADGMELLLWNTRRRSSTMMCITVCGEEIVKSSRRRVSSYWGKMQTSKFFHQTQRVYYTCSLLSFTHAMIVVIRVDRTFFLDLFQKMWAWNMKTTHFFIVLAGTENSTQIRSTVRHGNEFKDMNNTIKPEIKQHYSLQRMGEGRNRKNLMLCFSNSAVSSGIRELNNWMI